MNYRSGMAQSTDGGEQKLDLPPGFRFHPTDDELVMHYLCRKCAAQSIGVPIIAEVDIYKFDPWELPGMAWYGEKEWYFFSPRDRKYPNGSRPNRAAGTGYWKATGADKPIGKPKALGIKKALVFYAGKAPKGIKTNWIMHEYRLANVDRSAGKGNHSLRLDDWVLCRIYNKKGTLESYNYNNFDQSGNGFRSMENFHQEDQKPRILMEFGHSNHHEHDHQRREKLHQTSSTSMNKDFLHFETSESVPRLHTDSSGSEQVVSSDFHCEKEVQSEPKWSEFERVLDYQMNFGDGFLDNDPFGSQIQYNENFSSFQDIFFNTQRPQY